MYLAHWFGPEIYEGSIVGVFVHEDEGGLAFSHAGVSPTFQVQDGGLIEMDLEMEGPPALGTTTVEKNLGAYSSNPRLSIAWFEVHGVRFDGMDLPGTTLEGPEVTMPSDGGALLLIGSDREGNSAFVQRPPAFGGTTTLTLPSEVKLARITPSFAETNVSLTPRLAWTEVPEVLSYEVTIENDEGYRVRWFLPAGVSEIDVPHLPAHRFALQPETRYRWRVQAIFDPEYTVDARVTPPEGGEDTRPWRESLEGYLSDGSFTTAP